jgi:hypothetical protein
VTIKKTAARGYWFREPVHKPRAAKICLRFGGGSTVLNELARRSTGRRAFFVLESLKILTKITAQTVDIFEHYIV